MDLDELHKLLIKPYSGFDLRHTITFTKGKYWIRVTTTTKTARAKLLKSIEIIKPLHLAISNGYLVTVPEFQKHILEQALGLEMQTLVDLSKAKLECMQRTLPLLKQLVDLKGSNDTPTIHAFHEIIQNSR